MKKVMLTAFVALSVAMPLVASANQIINGDFSSDYTTGWNIKDANTNATVWATSGGVTTATAQNFSAYWIQPNGPTGAQALSTLRQQNIPQPVVGNGLVYRLEWDYKTQGSGWTNGVPSGFANDFSRIELQLITYDASGANINNGPDYSSLGSIQTATGNAWAHYSKDINIVDGTSKFYLKFMAGFSATNGNALDMEETGWMRDTFSVDNVSLTQVVVPEPGTILSMLSGLAGMGMMVIRKKRA
ncbi:MAG: PEP-CTERM sorting domain-containing protein [Armatimonadota bacterium]